MTSMLSTPQRTQLVSECRRELTKSLLQATGFPAVASTPLPDGLRGVDPLLWLSIQPFATRCVWGEREPGGDLVAAVGSAATVVAQDQERPTEMIRRCRQIMRDHESLRMFGGFSFNGGANLAWDGFGAGRFWLPRFWLQGATLHMVAVNAEDVPQALADVDQLILDAKVIERAHFAELPQPLRRDNFPNQVGWTANVDDALRMIHAEVLEKIVLARQVNVQFADALDVLALMRRLIDATHACYHFCFQVGPHQAFLGATPERLFRTRGRQLLSEVVAGTRPRGETVGQDQRLAYDLLTSDKDQLEHDIVRKSIRQRLHRLVSKLEVDSHASLLKLARKQHLYSAVEGELKAAVTDGDIIERLHPTPAVGGYPPENALPEIARLEPFDRGWYAAPVGWISAAEAEFAVAIRSGHVSEHQLSLFSGAGIVAGSIAEDEWNEIENKISDFLDIVGAAPCD